VEELSVSESDALLSYLEKQREREDYQTAKVMWAIFKAQGCKIEGRDVEISDFVPRPDLTDEQKEAMLTLRMSAFVNLNNARFKGAK
jgi:hypothetical protein